MCYIVRIENQKEGLEKFIWILRNKINPDKSHTSRFAEYAKP